MAAGPVVMPNKAKLNYVSATGLLQATATNYRIALVTSAWTPANSTDEVWANASANEIANGNGYTTGGATLTSVALSETSGVVKFASANVVWTASAGSIPVWRRAVLYYLGTLNGKVNPIVGHFLGDSTPADVPATTSGNTLTLTCPAGGWLDLT